MAELSTTRANFYKQQYFPAVYYKQIFDLTVAEAGDIQEAQRELNKLLIDADQNLARLSETFRERSLSPGQQVQVEADKEVLRQEEKAAAGRSKAASEFAANPAAKTLNNIELALEAKRGSAPSLSPADRNAVIEAELRKAVGGLKNQAAIRKIAVDVWNKYGQSTESLNVVRGALGDPGLTFSKIVEQSATPEDQASIKSMAGGGGELTPTGKGAKSRLDALSSPFANGSTEQTGHIAAGVTDEEDELLRLYLERLQDRESPGVISDAEIAATPDLAKAERVYQKVRGENSFQKSAAEWFSAEYLSALKTKSDLEAKAEADPFGGLDPYRWAQREALKRGGYTKESLLHLRMLEDRPDLAPYVAPAFTRLRAEGGLDPQSAAEATVRAAFEANPKITLAELDAILNEKRAALTQQGRQVARQPGVGVKEAIKERKGAREVANDLYASPEAAEQAKAYLLALRLNKAGTPAKPDVGLKVEIPVSKASVAPTPAEVAAATAARAQAQVQEKMAPPPPTTPSEPSEDEIDQTFTYAMDPARRAALEAQKARLEARQKPAPVSAWERALSGFVPDPTGGGWKYRRDAQGNIVATSPDSGLPMVVRPGDKAYGAIAAALGGPAPAIKPKVTPKPAAPQRAPAPAQRTPSVEESDAYYEAQATKAIKAAAPPAPAPVSTPAPVVPAVATPSVRPKVKVVRDPVTGKLIEVQE